MSLPNWFIRNVGLALFMLLFLVVLKVVYSLLIMPNMVYKKLKRNGLNGPTPSFPFGNINDMVASKKRRDSSVSFSISNTISHDIHSNVVPYFSQWQKFHGNNIHVCVCVFSTDRMIFTANVLISFLLLQGKCLCTG